MKKTLLLFTLFAMLVYARSQEITVKGVITNDKGGFFDEGEVLIQLKGKETRTFVISKDGTYSFPANYGDTLIFMAIDYMPYELQVTNNIANIQLKRRLCYLDEDELIILIKGIVVDAHTQQAVEGAKIVRPRSLRSMTSNANLSYKSSAYEKLGEQYENDQHIYVLSDEKGYFSMAGNDGITLQILHPDYETKDVIVEASDLKIELIPKNK